MCVCVCVCVCVTYEGGPSKSEKKKKWIKKWMSVSVVFPDIDKGICVFSMNIITRGRKKKKGCGNEGQVGFVCVCLYFLLSSPFLLSPSLFLLPFLSSFIHLHYLHPQIQIPPWPRDKEVTLSSQTEIPQWWEEGNQSTWRFGCVHVYK